MQQQTYLPQHPITPFGASEDQKAREQWKLQLYEWLHDYRDRYVLGPPPKRPAP